MPKKDRSFIIKMKKGLLKTGKSCPHCGELYTYVKYVNSLRSEKTGGWRYNQRMVPVCKCNYSEIYG
ncbi:MAG: hypothetical protein ACE5QV_03020 [Fidelibacterota bacterium]